MLGGSIDLDRVSLIDRGRVRALRLTQVIGSDSPSGNQPNPAHPIPINNLEVWLSGLRHWFAKSTYNLSCIMGSNPISSGTEVEQAGEIT